MRFLGISVGSRDNGDFDITRRTTPEDNLGCESSTQPTVSWEWEPREAFKNGTLATTRVSIDELDLERPYLDWSPTTASC
jgi:hypothetical protein